MLRGERTIQRAHDVLHGILHGTGDVGEVTFTDPSDRETMQRSLDVLCWVLCHQEGGTFQAVMEHIEECMNSSGIVMVERDEEQDG